MRLKVVRDTRWRHATRLDAQTMITSLHTRLDLAAGVAVFLTACGAGEFSQSSAVRDSAGITIIESSQPRWNAAQAWTLSPTPSLQIGRPEGTPEYQFYRVAGALRLADGSIVVADAESAEIRLFDGSGKFLKSTGGRGEAPGEYRQITAMGRGPADSIWVYDFGLRRFTVLTRDCEAVRTVSVGGTLSAVAAVGRLPDGSFLVKEGWSAAVNENQRQGLVRDPVAVVRMQSDGSDHDTVTTVAGREVFIGTENGRAVMSSPLFARNSSAAIRGDAVFVGDQTTLEVSLYSGEGRVERVFRVLGVDLGLTSATVARHKEELLAREPAERRVMLRRHYDAMTTPPSRPAYGDLVVDAEGNLWTGEYVRYPMVPEVWTVFSAAGELLGDVRLPQGFGVLDIGSDWILGVGRDEMDIEYMQLYGIEKE